MAIRFLKITTKDILKQRQVCSSFGLSLFRNSSLAGRRLILNKGGACPPLFLNIIIMKQEIFNTYAKKLCELFNLHEEDLFSKTKKRACVDARHLLYYVCHKRPMRIRYIQDYMANKGYDISHSSVIHGINQVSEKVENDSDYHNLVNTLNNV